MQSKTVSLTPSSLGSCRHGHGAKSSAVSWTRSRLRLGGLGNLNRALKEVRLEEEPTFPPSPIQVESSSTLLLDRGELQITYTTVLIFLIVTNLSTLDNFLISNTHAHNGRKRKYSGHQRQRGQAEQSSPHNHPGHTMPSAISQNGDSAAQPIIATAFPLYDSQSIIRLGDILYKFDPNKYWQCSTRGCSTVSALFRPDVMLLLQWHNA